MKEKNISLKSSQIKMTEEESKMTYMTKRFQKIVKKHGFLKEWNINRVAEANDLCHKCGKPGHFMRDCPSQKQ